MTTTVGRFEARLAPCGGRSGGDSFVCEDEQGLMTEELRYSCGCKATKEEFHDGSVHLLTMDHKGRVVSDQELRGE